ncbi:unnamed protein product, partial [Didymodactylos carnosus]
LLLGGACSLSMYHLATMKQKSQSILVYDIPMAIYSIEFLDDYILVGGNAGVQGKLYQVTRNGSVTTTKLVSPNPVYSLSISNDDSTDNSFLAVAGSSYKIDVFSNVNRKLGYFSFTK